MGSLRRAGARSRRRSLSTEAGLEPRLEGVWEIGEQRAEVAALTARVGAVPKVRSLWRRVPTGRGLVIGSTQSASSFDPERLTGEGLLIARRASGGGAVLVEPSSQLWVDFFLPRSDPLVAADVGRSFHWLGELFRAALAEVMDGAVAPAAWAVHRGPAERTAWSRVACFAALGSGEVSAEGRKVVGISQRRDRSGSWFHSIVVLDSSQVGLSSLLAVTEAERIEASSALARSGLDPNRAPTGHLDIPGAIYAALIRRLA